MDGSAELIAEEFAKDGKEEGERETIDGKEIGKIKKKKRKGTASELNENERDARDKRKPVTTDRMII